MRKEKSLKTKIQEQMKEALRSHDQMRLDTLRLLLSEIKNKEIEKRGDLEEGEIVSLIRKEIKKREESEEYFKKGNRPELLDKAEKEIAILQEFVPLPLSEEEIEQVVDEVLAHWSGEVSLGPVMKEVMSHLQGRAEGKVVSNIVRQKISAG